jgi:hypothetical protein
MENPSASMPTTCGTVWRSSRTSQPPPQTDVEGIVGTHRHEPEQLPAIVDVVVPALRHGEPLSPHAASAAMRPYPLPALPSPWLGVGDMAPG